MKLIALSLFFLPLSTALSADDVAELKARITLLEQRLEHLQRPRPEVVTEDVCLIGVSECGITEHGQTGRGKYRFQYSTRSSLAYIYGPNKEIVRAKQLNIKYEQGDNWKNAEAARVVCQRHIARIRATIPDCE